MKHAQFTETPLSSIRPAGWIRRWLELQKHVRAPYTPDPWCCPPVMLRVPARTVAGWKILHKKRLPGIGGKLVDPARNKWVLFPQVVKGDFILTPPLPGKSELKRMLKGKTEIITLVPYGATQLRIAVFPYAGKGK